jgi:hypothetical protein
VRAIYLKVEENKRDEKRSDAADGIRFALDNEIPLKMVQYLEMDQR